MNYLRYGMVHAATAAAVIGLYEVVLLSTGVNILTSFLPILPSMVAAMLQGASHALATGQVPGQSAAWRFALAATALSVGLLGGYYVILNAVYPAFLTALAEEIGLAILGPALLAVLGGVIFLVNRFMLTFNARQTLKAVAKRPGGKL
jgi:hypothetical protein